MRIIIVEDIERIVLQKAYKEEIGGEILTLEDLKRLKIAIESGVTPIVICAEQKAATAAQYNDSEILNNKGNPYSLSNYTFPNRIALCPIGEVNKGVYMNYANNK